MNITIKRIAWRSNYIIGKFFIDGVYFCDTLENLTMCIKPYNYRIICTFSPKFHRKLPLVIVPGRTGIRIHQGNTSKDTIGCILVGKNTIVGKLTDSRKTLDKLIKVINYPCSLQYK